jgi:hypothetical protein
VLGHARECKKVPDHLRITNRLAMLLLRRIRSLLAQSGHASRVARCPLSGVKRTSARAYGKVGGTRLRHYVRHFSGLGGVCAGVLQSDPQYLCCYGASDERTHELPISIPTNDDSVIEPGARCDTPSQRFAQRNVVAGSCGNEAEYV